MNTPTEFLEGIHSVLESLPDDLASLLGSTDKADLPDFVMPASIDMAPTEASLFHSGTSAGTPDYPEFGQAMSGMPNYPELGSAGRSGGADAAFPDMLGFSSASSSMPTPADAERDTDQLILGQLEDIARNTANLSRGEGSKEGFQRSSGPQQINHASVWARN